MNHRSYGYGPGVKMKKTECFPQIFLRLEDTFLVSLMQSVTSVESEHKFFLAKTIGQEQWSYWFNPTQLFSAQNVIEEASDRNHNMEFLAKKVHDNSLEMTVQRDTCSNNPEKPSSEPCKLLYAIPLWIFEYCCWKFQKEADCPRSDGESSPPEQFT